jgi:enoyl-CoA hydratase
VPGYDNLIVEAREGGVGLIRIHRPERRNALDQATMSEIVRAAEAFDRDDAIGCLVLTGDERAFAAGADVREMDGKGVSDMLADDRFEQWERLRRLRTPVVAALSGYALGGGLELAMLCDMIVASESARLGQPEINLGIMPGAGGTQRLTRQLGKYLAMEVVLGGRLLDAQEALRHGLVNRVAPVADYLEEALSLARVVAARAPLAARLAKDAVARAQDLPLEQALAFERHSFYLLFGSEDQREGIRAFLEKRDPHWKGR